MNAFFLLYALTITLELVLFIFLIVVPRGEAAHAHECAPARRPLASTTAGAVADAFATVSEGRDDLTTILHAKLLLERTAEGGGDRL